MDSVRLIKGKAAPWVKEDEPAILAQLKWLRGLSETEKKLYIVASHDEDERKDLIANGVLGDGLE